MTPISKYVIKGSAVRAYVKQLEELGKLEAVLLRVSPEAAAMARNPPLASSWHDAHPLAELVEGYCALEGRPAVLELGRAAVEKQMVPLLMPMMKGILRVIGVSPATVFARYQSILQSTVRGTEYKYTALSPKSGQMEVRYDTDKHIPWSVFAQNVSGFEAIFRVCGVKGEVAELKLLGNNTARFPLAW